VLVGDAAGFYDPFTGEGVTLALRSAELAAAAIGDALERPGGGPAAAARELRARPPRATRAKFRFNRTLQLIVGWPEAANTMARKLRRRPDLADRLVGSPATSCPPGRPSDRPFCSTCSRPEGVG
jgi:flavin-dependent dehydrogenase